MSDILRASGLTRRFHNCEAVHDLDLAVPAGCACAFLGRNGAGKTTTIKMLAGLLRPSAGACSLLGCDSQKLGPSQWQKIGYVSESQQLYDWMTGAQLIRFTAKLYPAWDSEFEKTIAHKLELPLESKVRRYSRGERMKLALLLALAFRPRLLILDEPFTGLDPLVKEEFLDSLLEITAQSEWTIFFATHDMDEVEKVADRVAIIEEGRLQVNEPLDALQARFRRVEVLGGDSPATAPGALEAESVEGRLRYVTPAFAGDEAALAQRHPGARVEVAPMSLREIFLTLAREHQRRKRQA